MLVGEGSGLVFIGHKFPDEVVHLLYLHLFAFGIGDAVAEEIAQGEYSEGSLHILAVAHARYSGDIIPGYL